MSSNVVLPDQTIRSTIRFARLFAVFIALSIPLIYFTFAYLHESRLVESQAISGAELVSQLNRQNPELAKNLDLRVDSPYEISTGAGIVLTSINITELDSPIIHGTAQIDLAEQGLGEYRAYSSLQPLLINTVLASLLGLLLAGSSYYLLMRIPVQGLRHADQHVRQTQKDLETERDEKERALRRVEYSGQAIRHLASHDLLTDLPNRTYLEGSLRETINDYKNGGDNFFALYLLDLNRFKDINDSLGHQSGDLVIREVARRLSRIAPSPHTLARLDGDEFAILNPLVKNKEDSERYANHVLETLEQPLALKGYSLDTSATLGISFYPQHGTEADILIQHADIAMYTAKKSKKDFVVFDASMQSEQLNHLSMRGDLRNAIEAGNMEVFYQPKINMQSGHIYGVEALARWIHPERGPVSPALFIPIAEQTGLIHPLTGLVMNISLNQAASWRQQQRDIGVAINLSVRSLHDPHLPERIQVLLETWDIPANQVTLEITESAIMADPGKALEVLTELAEMGTHVSIDDYGTGYSSLSYLKRLPVSEIKIDRSFVGDMINNDNDSVIVRATIDMAHDLGLKVTAEGVEDQQTWDKLAEFGCDNAQGFYMGKPQNAEELNRWFCESKWSGQALN
jgi:diguanylate cyclase (GGDEF)-like protein